jgi:2'-5' RNA ligase
MSESWRCFVGVDIGEELRASLAEAMAGWRGDPRTAGLRWVDPAALHLTLAFLGDTEPSRVPRITHELAEVTVDHRGFDVPTGRLGAFARPGSARVLWYGVGDPGGGLTRLAADVARALEVDDAAEYRPHVTLARARRRAVDLRGWIEAASLAAPAGRIVVDALRLMRSQLGGGPARYETLASVSLPARA